MKSLVLLPGPVTTQSAHRTQLQLASAVSGECGAAGLSGPACMMRAYRVCQDAELQLPDCQLGPRDDSMR